MRVLSLFSGIEAASVAWEPLGWEIVAVSEIEPFPCKVLAHHYPNVPNLGDVTKITEAQIKALGRIDLVVFGSPCQDLSVAGKRKGLQGERSGLFYTAMQIVRWSGARFALWENVPGAFSSHKEADFAEVVREMGGSDDCPDLPRQGWGTEGVALGKEALVEWATLDAQWFGVAQRRRRVFALADFGNWFDRPPILLECQSLRGDIAPSREKGQEVTEVAGTLAANGGGTKRPAGNANELDFCITTNRMVAFGEYVDDDLAGSLKQRDYKDATQDQHLAIGWSEELISYGIPGNWINRKPENGGNAVEPMHDVAPCQTKTDVHAVAFNQQASIKQGLSVSEHITPTLDKSKVHAVAYGVSEKPDVAHCLRSGASKADKHESTTYVAQAVAIGWSEELNALENVQPTIQRGGQGGRREGVLTPTMQVRRLTPKECERLQGFPDDYTNIPGASDSARYKALGNSMAVPVMHWIGKRIKDAVTVQDLLTNLSP